MPHMRSMTNAPAGYDQPSSKRPPLGGAGRLLALGLDGGDLPYIQSRARALPTLNRLLDQGRIWPLEAPLDLSGAVWPTFYNGCHPGEHGTYQHFVWDAERMGMRLIGPDWSFHKPFWKDLEADGHRTIILDVPYSFPGALKDGIEITDWGTHGQTRPTECNRPEVQAWLRRFGPSPIGRETPIKKTPSQLRAIQAVLRDSAARKEQLVRGLLETWEWDVFLTIFGETHRAGHMFFEDKDEAADRGQDISTPMLDIYQAVDRAIANILQAVDPQTAIVFFSVHGMMRNAAQVHLVAPLMTRLNAAFMAQEFGLPLQAPRGQGGAVGWLQRQVPTRLQYAVGAAAPDWFRRWVVQRQIVGGLDWAQTPGFALRTDIRTELRLNLKGREARGLLEPGSPAHLRYVAFLREVFLGLKDAETGARLIEDVVSIPERFPGPRAHRLPDLVAVWRDEPPAGAVVTPHLGPFVVQRPSARGGDHRDSGFACAVLPADVDPSCLTDPTRIEHLGGTIRDLMAHLKGGQPADAVVRAR